MKRIAVVCLLALAVVALASETETENEADVPTLPGLGSPCLPRRAPVNVRWQHRFEKAGPKSYGGQCVRESACAPLSTVHGYCAGIGVVCCKGGGSMSAIPRVNAPTLPTSPARPTLQATAGGCAARAGVCKDKATCTGGTAVAGLCPGTPANVQCCVPKSTTPTPTPVPTGTSLTTLIPIPAGINAGLQFPSANFQIGLLGRPGCALSTACFNCNCAVTGLVAKLRKTAKVTDTVSITGLGPFVDAVKAAFDSMAAAGGEAATARASVRSAGGLCCRPIKRSNGSAGGSWSNHSFGVAVDFYFGSTIDPRGDRKTQRGLAIMAPFFQRQGLYWAAGYGGSEEDAMHFEASVSKMNGWKAAGLLR